MKIGILGSGVVAQTIGGKLAEIGQEVKLGSRETGKLSEWLGKVGSNASAGSFSEAAAFGEVVFNCTAGIGSLEALELAGAANLEGKILIDVTNPLDFSKGFPPTLTVCNDDSLAEQIQRAYPATKVVKTLNTITTAVMVNPGLVPGDHDVFISGNDSEAKATVSGFLKDWFGWKEVTDLGDISSARVTEMLMPFWLQLYKASGNAIFGYKIVKG